MGWPLVLPTLKDRGWVVKPGSGLIAYYYCCSKFAGESVEYMLKHAKRGDEYFTSEEEIKTFCREQLEWVGSDSESGERGSSDEVESVTNKGDEILAAEALSLEDIESLYLRKKREREDAIAAAESLPLPVLEEICRKKKVKLSTIDLTTESTDIIEPDGSGTALQNMEKAAEEHSARFVVVKKEKDGAQEKLAAAKDDAEIFEETVQQQTMTTEIWQERFKEVFQIALEAGADGKTLSSIRDRSLTNGH